MARVLMLLPTTTYKSHDFLEAAGRLGVEVVVGTDRRQALETTLPGHTLSLDFVRPDRGVRSILGEHQRAPFEAVIGADDETTVLASMAASALGLRHNPVEVVRALRDKHRMRRLLAAAGLRGPGFRLVPPEVSPEAIATTVDYPCVIKPRFLSASRGVLRADGPEELVRAFARVRSILELPDVRRREGYLPGLLVEDYLPGAEMSLEGLLSDGRLRLLALFDKPDPLEGPIFEETIYVTPSKASQGLQDDVVAETTRACRAIGLVEGPVHAELRLHEGRPVILEVAARSIGGLCSRTLRFGAGISLEELILRHALGRETGSLEREGRAAGVMMIPIPAAGVLQRVRGLEQARSVRGIEEVTLTAHRGTELVPLPEGNQYLGFIFARATRADEAEAALRLAHARLRFEIGH